MKEVLVKGGAEHFTPDAEFLFAFHNANGVDAGKSDLTEYIQIFREIACP